MNEPLMHATIALAARCAARSAPPTEEEMVRIAQEIARARGLSHHDGNALLDAARSFAAPWDEPPQSDPMLEMKAPRLSATPVSTVLFLAVSPTLSEPLKLDEECRTIEKKVRTAAFRDQIRFRSRWAARPHDLLCALNDDSPSILHFSGHGTGDQGLCFQAEDSRAIPIGAEELVQVMRVAGVGINIMVLNACFSDAQAQALAAHIPCVIQMPDTLGDGAAIMYAGAFYRALAFGKSVANAHENGIAALALHSSGKSGRDIDPMDAALGMPIPRLLTRTDTDAGRIYMVESVRRPVDVQGSVNETRVHIEITVDTRSFDTNVLDRVMTELRRLGGDQSVRTTHIRKGNVR